LKKEGINWFSNQWWTLLLIYHLNIFKYWVSVLYYKFTY